MRQVRRAAAYNGLSHTGHHETMASLTGRMFGHYHILERIGRGGMATVYRALDRKTDRELAIKFISPALAETEEFLRRFRREVKVVARMSHPHILPVLDYGEQDGYAYLVMPLLELGSLRNRLQSGSVSLQEGGRVLDQVAQALEYAHRLGIVHRDVKPSNILLDPDGNALLADFGLARPVGASHSLTGSAVVGTPAYMAPEQIQGGPVDGRCDQYALGVLLFQLATGSLPFEADTPMGYLLKHVNEQFPSAQRRNAKVPETIDRVIRRATAKDPDQRFETVAAMNQALQASLAHVVDPITNRAPTIQVPTGAVGQTSGLRRRRGLRIAAAIGGGLVLVLALPVLASGLVGLLERASNGAEGSAEVSGAIQLTSLAGTIAAMSTELAGQSGTPLSDDQLATAIMRTLIPGGQSDAASLAESTGLEGSQTATIEGAAGSTPTPPAGTASSSAGATAPVAPSPSATSNPASSPTTATTAAPPSASPTGSWTPAPATLSPTPTSTATITPAPTQTGAPTTAPSATQDFCPQLSLGGFGSDGDQVWWRLTNGSSIAVTITRIQLSWPAAHGALDRIRFDGSSIWHGTDSAPPSDISSGWTGNRTLAGSGSAKDLQFEFTAAAGGGYGVDVTLNGSCTRSAGS